jgi:hypothetical protein
VDGSSRSSSRRGEAPQAPSSATVVPLQALSFGLLFPGTREIVSINDVARRALVALSGSGPVDITLVLPASLTSPDGGSIPLHFSSTDAGVLPSLGGVVSPLNPYQVNRIQLAPDRAVHFVIGGTAEPTTTLHPGHYSGRVLVIVSQPGT